MSIKERKEREKLEMQELILNAASEIFKTEGLDKLSIRKIASKIDYSPAIVYHYFEDKEDIISHMMRRGYGKIVEGLTSVPSYEDTPEKKLKAMTRQIIHMALKMPEEYSAVQLNTSPGVLQHTASLFKGAAHKKPALEILFKCLKDIYTDMDDDKLELTAQIIWTSTFGIIMKLIIEKDLSEEQQNNLIEHHIKCIIDTMIFGNPLNS